MDWPTEVPKGSTVVSEVVLDLSDDDSPSLKVYRDPNQRYHVMTGDRIEQFDLTADEALGYLCHIMQNLNLAPVFAVATSRKSKRKTGP